MRNEARAPRSLQHLALWAALALAAFLPRGPSAAAELYRVDGVEVEATAESAVAAREAAIAAGEREGLARLLRRLTAPSDHGRLPELAGRPLDPFVQSFEIAEERVAPTSYAATLNLSYVAAEVQGLLAEAGIPFVTRRSEPILVAPVEVTPTGTVPWLEPSPWRDAWYAAVEDATVATLVLPLADLGDVAAAPPEALAAGDRAALDALALRYGAQGVVVATAELARAPETGALERVDVTARDGARWTQPLVRESVVAAPEEEESETLARAAALVVDAVEADWKQRTLVPVPPASRLVAEVPLAGLSSWVQIRNQLAGLPEVRSLEVQSFSRDRVRLAIGHDVGLAELAGALGRAGLSLAEEEDGWHLRPAGGPAGYPAPWSASPPG